MKLKNIIAYKHEINETLEWMKEERSETEFDEWCYSDFGRDDSYECRFSPPTGESIILGGINSLGADCQQGRLHLVQCLMELGYIDAVTRDGIVHYKTVKGLQSK
jgi:hypothetical protein